MKKNLLLFCILAMSLGVKAQSKIENIIIVTTDGLRWQDVFKGMDPEIANNKKFNQRDSAYLYEKYWSENLEERRAKLLPFLWGTIGKQGQIFGNRDYGCKVDNANPYWFSYPGYSEIFCGFVDEKINTNSYPNNPHENVLEFINHQPQFKGKVAAFGAWNAFDRILNEPRAGFPVVAAFDKCGGSNPTANEQLVNSMLEDSYKPWGEAECLDVFTNYAAFEQLKIKKPKVLYIAYGETDEWAHAGQYRDYLNAAHQVDAWLQKLWEYVQSQSQYKDKTALLITVDHGRGNQKKEEWTSHGQSVADAHEIWFAIMAPGLAAKGEVQQDLQLYQKQFAQTIASLIGLDFKANHPVAEAIKEIH
ncbi:alkaline phosphatase family protein [Solitalea koreensis]|uniref:Metalloenzyme superfamily protein n=1 Tax=Solitalea koreensis TaxID=543615 RepID=A0A521AGH1_9SPHI|nr:sulfatase-like hydrolase/transferase [Solitalea koreensis]SMO33800.1 Metalloenzyme superfamily protein [Solitalea koreensis]